MKKPSTTISAPGGLTSDEQLQPATAAPGNLSKAPRLKRGNDAEVAGELGRLVRDAQSATRRLLICGLFIEHIVANLPHGQFGPWVDAHKEEIGASYPSICGWRKFAKSAMEAVGFQNSNALEFSIPMHEAVALPTSEVPEDMRKAREKIDELIEGKSVKQLMLNFKESAVVNDELRVSIGGHHPKRDENGEIIPTPRRTKEEIDREKFEGAAIPACAYAREYIDKALSVEGPHGEKAVWLLNERDLEGLKMAAYDLHQMCLEAQARRAAKRGGRK